MLQTFDTPLYDRQKGSTRAMPAGGSHGPCWAKAAPKPYIHSRGRRREDSPLTGSSQDADHAIAEHVCGIRYIVIARLSSCPGSQVYARALKLSFALLAAQDASRKADTLQAAIASTILRSPCKQTVNAMHVPQEGLHRGLQ